MTILVGADPELFLRNKQGQFISAFNVVPGTKHEPFKVDRGAIQVDGVAAEFNIDPTTTAEDFTANIKTVLGQLNDYVQKQDLTMFAVPTATFENEYWYFNVDPHSKELGCDPDFDAYTLDMTKSPAEHADEPFRTGAGHIHMGWQDRVTDSAEHFENCARIARHMDFFVGLPSLSWDNDNSRRKLYGKPGCFRPKVYGVEYRTLSNAWLLDAAYTKYVFNQTQKCWDVAVSSSDPFDGFGTFAKDVIEAGDADWATSSKTGQRVAELIGFTGPIPPEEKLVA